MRSWAHAHEEDTASVQVYRPSDSGLPPARGRRVVTLNADGSLLLGRPGPDDRATAAAGSWSLDGSRLTLRPETGRVQEFDVQSLVADCLVLHPRDRGVPGA